MSTVIRPEISEKSKYWISRNRYYELKHFCLQYPDWKAELEQIVKTLGYSALSFEREPTGKTNLVHDTVFICAERREVLLKNIALVDTASKEAGRDLSRYLIKGVTEGWSYTQLKMSMQIPCCRDSYYDIYRKFFWLLDKTRK